MKKLVLISVILSALCAVRSFAALQIDNGPASNITTTAADFYGTITSTNGSGTNTVILYYGTTDYSNNATSWASSNVYYSATNAALGTISTNISGLTAASKYYYRWYLLEGSTSDWANATSNFWTLAGVPTNSAPAAPYRPLMVDTQGSIVAPTNFLAQNGIARTNDTAGLQSQISSNDSDISSALLQISSNDTDLSSAFLQISSNDTDISSAFLQVSSNDTDIANLTEQIGSDLSPTNSFQFANIVLLKPADNLSTMIADTNTLYLLPPGTFSLSADIIIPHGSIVRGSGYDLTVIDGGSSYDFSWSTNATLAGFSGLTLTTAYVKPEGTPVAQQTVIVRDCYLSPDAGPCFFAGTPSNLIVDCENVFMPSAYAPAEGGVDGWWTARFYGLDGGSTTFLTKNRFFLNEAHYVSNVVVSTALTFDSAYISGTFTTNAPSAGEVAKWDAVNSKWYAAPDSTGTGGANAILSDGSVAWTGDENGGFQNSTNWNAIKGNNAAFGPLGEITISASGISALSDLISAANMSVVNGGTSGLNVPNFTSMTNTIESYGYLSPASTNYMARLNAYNTYTTSNRFQGAMYITDNAQAPYITGVGLAGGLFDYTGASAFYWNSDLRQISVGANPVLYADSSGSVLKDDNGIWQSEGTATGGIQVMNYQTTTNKIEETLAANPSGWITATDLSSATAVPYTITYAPTVTLSRANGWLQKYQPTSTTEIQIENGDTGGVDQINLTLWAGTNSITFATGIVSFAAAVTPDTNAPTTILYYSPYWATNWSASEL